MRAMLKMYESSNQLPRHKEEVVIKRNAVGSVVAAPMLWGSVVVVGIKMQCPCGRQHNGLEVKSQRKSRF